MVGREWLHSVSGLDMNHGACAHQRHWIVLPTISEHSMHIPLFLGETARRIDLLDPVRSVDDEITEMRRMTFDRNVHLAPRRNEREIR